MVKLLELILSAEQMLLDEVAFPQPCFAARSAAALHRKVKESRIALLALRNATNNQYPLLAAVIASCFVFGINELHGVGSVILLFFCFN